MLLKSVLFMSAFCSASSPLANGGGCCFSLGFGVTLGTLGFGITLGTLGFCCFSLGTLGTLGFCCFSLGMMGFGVTLMLEGRLWLLSSLVATL